MALSREGGGVARKKVYSTIIRSTGRIRELYLCQMHVGDYDTLEGLLHSLCAMQESTPPQRGVAAYSTLQAWGKEDQHNHATL